MSLHLTHIRKPFWVLIGAALVIYALTLCNLTSFSYIGTDFGKFYNSSRAYWLGKDIYLNEVDVHEVAKIDPDHHFKHVYIYNLNPPAMVLYLLPIGLMSYKNAYLAWNFISCLLLMLSVYIVWQAFFKNRSKVSLPFLLFTFLIFYPAVINFFAGQVTFLLLALLLLAWECGRREYWKSCGIILGTAFCLKLFFGLFLLLLCKQRNWQACVAFVLTVLVVIALTMGVFGPTVYTSYHEMFNHVTWYTATWNVSWYGFYARLFPLVKESGYVLLPISWIGMPCYLLSIAVVLWGLLKLLNKYENILQLSWDLPFAYITVAMVLLSPLGWLYYFPFFLLPVCILYREYRKRQHANIMLIILAITGLVANIPVEMLLPLQITNYVSAFVKSVPATLVEVSLLLMIYFVDKFKPQKVIQLTELNIFNLYSAYCIYFMMGMYMWYHLLRDILQGWHL